MGNNHSNDNAPAPPLVLPSVTLPTDKILLRQMGEVLRTFVPSGSNKVAREFTADFGEKSRNSTQFIYRAIIEAAAGTLQVEGRIATLTKGDGMTLEVLTKEESNPKKFLLKLDPELLMAFAQQLKFNCSGQLPPGYEKRWDAIKSKKSDQPAIT